MNARSSFLLVCGCGGLLLGTAGSERGSLRAAPPDAATVSVSRPVAREVIDHVDFGGRTQAVNSVNVVARASGYLVKQSFQEGTDVKKGDPLFEIDPRPYQAQFDLAAAQVDLNKAQLKLAQATLERDEQVARTTPAAVSAQQLDQDRNAVAHAMAQIAVAQASLENFRLDLDFCRVTAPFDGRVGRSLLSVGSLVTQDQTVLTTVVSLDPMYVYFDVDDASMLRVRKAIDSNQPKAAGGGQIPILMGLASEEGFPHKANIDFVNNQVDPATGTLQVRGVFANPLPGDGGPRLLLPGMFARIRLPIGQPQPALLVVDRAVRSDRDGKFVYVVNAQGEIERRPIEAGPLESDGLRVIRKGLMSADDHVVVGRQPVRPGMKVQIEEVPMPLKGESK